MPSRVRTELRVEGLEARDVPSGAPISWATVGDPGNVGDPDRTNPAFLRGSVPYTFRIARHELSNAQYAEFLNAVDPAGADARGLYPPVYRTAAIGGIVLNRSAPAGARWRVEAGQENQPVILSWLSAARFANWMHNGRGTGGTETGAYTIPQGVDFSLPENWSAHMQIRRNAGARFAIPSDDEWYKTAYYKGGGPDAGFWLYPTQSDQVPHSAPPPGTAAPDPTNVGNVNRNDGVANGYDDGVAVPGIPPGLDPERYNYLTDVGSYASTTTAYGTYDMLGNLWEWTEGISGFGRYNRGGTYNINPEVAQKSFYCPISVDRGDWDIGFRLVALTPPPVVAEHDAAATYAGQPVTFNLLANDTGVGRPLTPTLLTDPNSGTVTLAADGTVTYTPAAGFTGNAFFTYQVSDGTLASNLGVVDITVLPRPTVTLAATDASAAESGDTGTFRVTRSAKSSLPLTVSYTVGGTATAGADYGALSGTVTIPAGATTATFRVAPVNDGLAEGRETVVVTLAAGPTYVLGSAKTATVTLHDDDRPTVTASVKDGSAGEAGANPGVIRITRTPGTSGPLTVYYSTGGTAANGVDYAPLSGVAVIPAGASYVDVVVQVLDDTDREGSEWMTLLLTADPAYDLGTLSVALTLTDND